jgi:predicted transglutaminase-like cysteine proteinase
MKALHAIVILASVYSLCGCAADATSAIAPTLAISADQPGLPISTPLRDGAAPAAIPSGFVGFCLRFADQCALPRNGATSIALNLQNFAQISQINRSINEAIKPEDDSVHYGPAEYWTIPTDGYGDCEDYALTKRKALADAGFPVGALRLALVITAQKERHAVLTLATDRGDFVLDNLSDTVRPWTEPSYTWLERQDSTRSWRWDMLSADNVGSAPTAATSRR